MSQDEFLNVYETDAGENPQDPHGALSHIEDDFQALVAQNSDLFDEAYPASQNSGNQGVPNTQVTNIDDTAHSEEATASDGYVLNALGIQVFGQTTGGVGAKYFRGRGAFMLNDYTNATGTGNGMFSQPVYTNTPLRGLYDNTTPIGRTAERLYGAGQYDKTSMDYKNAGKTAKSTSATMHSMSRLIPVMTSGSLLLTQHDLMSAVEKNIVATDFFAGLSTISSNTLMSTGHQFSKNSLIDQSNLALSGGNVVNIVGNSARIAGNGMRIYNELASADPNLSTITSATVDSGFGAMQISKSSYLLHAVTQTADAVDKNDVLMNVVKYPPALTKTMQTFGVAGAVLGAGTNGTMIYTALTDDTLPTDEKNEKLISGSLGLTGTILIGAGALLVAPVVAPIGLGLSVAGTGFLIAQAVYDYREPIGEAIVAASDANPEPLAWPEYR
jgi:hypothetical protein